MMEIGGLTDQDHEVLGVEYCSGYTDSFGKWNTGFYCPTLGNGERVYCCGTLNQKYCCTRRDEERAPTIDQTLLLGIVLGAMVVVVIVTIVSCLICRRCLTQRKRHHAATNGGPLYRMHCSSTASGVANMYSFSGQNSSATTPIEGLEPHLMVDLASNNPNGPPSGQLPISHVHQHHLQQRHSAVNGGGGAGTLLPRVPTFGNGPLDSSLARNLRVVNNSRFGHCPLSHTEPPPPYQTTEQCSSIVTSPTTCIGGGGDAAILSNSNQRRTSSDLILSATSQMANIQNYRPMSRSPSTTSFTPMSRRERAAAAAASVSSSSPPNPSTPTTQQEQASSSSSSSQQRRRGEEEVEPENSSRTNKNNSRQRSYFSTKF